jgi:hypothetical protein
MKEISSLRSSWRESWRYTIGEMAAAALSQGEAEQQLSNEIAELKSAAEWQVKATEMKKIAWEIMMICPFAERNCSRGDCMNRASH